MNQRTFLRTCLVMVGCVFLVTVVQCSPVFAQKLTVEDILKKVDELYRATSSKAVMEMSITTPNWERMMKMEAWSEGMDKTFIVILEPKKDAGIATLRVDTEMWNYFPKINKVMKVPPSMMMGSWMGSDFTNDDLVKESSLIEDYSGELFEPEGADPDHYYLKLVPKAKTATVWGKIVIEAKKSDFLPIRQEYYDEKGTLMRVMTFSDVKELGGRIIPAIMELTPLNKEGNKTIIRYLSADFNIDLGDDVFTLRNLQKKR